MKGRKMFYFWESLSMNYEVILHRNWWRVLRCCRMSEWSMKPILGERKCGKNLANKCEISLANIIWKTKSLGAPGPKLLVCGPSGLLDFVLHALRALRPCDPRRCVHDACIHNMMHVSMMHVYMMHVSIMWCMYPWCMNTWYMYPWCMYP